MKVDQVPLLRDESASATKLKNLPLLLSFLRVFSFSDFVGLVVFTLVTNLIGDMITFDEFNFSGIAGLHV